MKGLIGSILIFLLTCAACFTMVGGESIAEFDVLRKAQTVTAGSGEVSGIVTAEGEFPGNMYYEYGDDRYIYYTEYKTKNGIYLYDTVKGVTELLVKPVRRSNSIHAFSRFEGTIVWEEDGGSVDGHEDGKVIDDWRIYVRKDGNTTKVDEGKPLQLTSKLNVIGPPQRLSIFEDYLVYKTYDLVPGAKDEGVVIKLYDIEKGRYKSIFSLRETEKYYVSDPCIYKNYVVWSAGEIEACQRGAVKKGDVYVYNIKTGSYGKIMEGEDLINPLIWEDYIACTRNGEDGKSIAVYNIKTGVMKDVASSDHSVFPIKEIQDYSIGGGYLTWNNSHADSVWIYDLEKGEATELVRSNTSEGLTNNLLNIRIYDKALLYKDHGFNRDSKETIYDVNKYMILN